MIYSEIAPAMQTIRTTRSPHGPRARCNSDDVQDDRFTAGPGRVAIRIAIQIATAATTKSEIQDNDNCLFVKETAQQA
jgi:hypothetical protein